MRKMETVTLDEKGRLTVPAQARATAKTKEFVVITLGKQVQIVPKPSLKQLLGLSKKVTAKDLRDEQERIA